eukprot:358883-Chlamydomonas_euryale.AAC.3
MIFLTPSQLQTPARPLPPAPQLHLLPGHPRSTYKASRPAPTRHAFPPRLPILRRQHDLDARRQVVVLLAGRDRPRQELLVGRAGHCEPPRHDRRKEIVRSRAHVSDPVKAAPLRPCHGPVRICRAQPASWSVRQASACTELLGRCGPQQRRHGRCDELKRLASLLSGSHYHVSDLRPIPITTSALATHIDANAVRFAAANSEPRTEVAGRARWLKRACRAVGLLDQKASPKGS